MASLPAARSRCDDWTCCARISGTRSRGLVADGKVMTLYILTFYSYICITKTIYGMHQRETQNTVE
ncbi:hypothetical protein CC79DRAFT_567225 [Sarocladium strictum]